MSLRDVLMVVGGIVCGVALMSVHLNNAALSGRLSACKDITTMLNRSVPLQLDCVISKSEVYITTPFQPGALISLDGTRIAE